MTQSGLAIISEIDMFIALYIIVKENDIIFDKINVYNLYWLTTSLIKYQHSNKLCKYQVNHHLARTCLVLHSSD